MYPLNITPDQSEGRRNGAYHNEKRTLDKQTKHSDQFQTIFLSLNGLYLR